LKFRTEFDIQDESGIAFSSYASYVAGQLDNGIVLWWECLYHNDVPMKMELVGQIMRIENAGKIREFDVTNHVTPQ
jgi:hypothetical protein